jgi:hypothetical protein
MVNKRAQLSIETMIIYGLIILVALSVIGGLLYFNIIDLGSYLPDKCDLGGTGDLKCEEMKFSPSGLSLGIRNIGQKPISSLQVSVTDNAGILFQGAQTGVGYVGTQQIGPTTVALAPGEIASVVIPGATGKTGKLLRGTLTTAYMFKDGAITQEATGSIRVKSS